MFVYFPISIPLQCGMQTQMMICERVGEARARQTGIQFGEMLIKEGLKNDKLPCAFEILTNGGWGKVRTKVNLTQQKLTVTIQNSITSRQTETKEPACHFISGYIAGVFSTAFGKTIDCMETKCKTKGDALCEFTICERS